MAGSKFLRQHCAESHVRCWHGIWCQDYKSQELQRKRYRKLHECPTTGFLQRSWRPTLTSTPQSLSLSPSSSSSSSSSCLASLSRRILCNRLINNSIHYCDKSLAYLLTLFRPFHILTLINFFFSRKRASYFRTKSLHFQHLLTVLPEETKNLVDQLLCEKLLKDGKRWHVN